MKGSERQAEVSATACLCELALAPAQAPGHAQAMGMPMHMHMHMPPEGIAVVYCRALGKSNTAIQPLLCCFIIWSSSYGPWSICTGISSGPD